MAFVLWVKISRKKVVKVFKSGNVITFGKKGNGKDVVHAMVIHLRKKGHYSNIPYDKNTIILAPAQYSVGLNDYKNFISGNVIKCKKLLLEGYDYYLSDGGIVLPSQYDTFLDKQYPGFPIAYALSRHLWGSNVHVNSQALDRVWKKLREQADNFVMCRSCTNLGTHLLVSVRIYEKYSTALQGLAPMKNSFLNKYARAEYNLYKAQNGSIEDLLLFVPKKWLKYDTRYFHQVLFGSKFVKTASKTKIIIERGLHILRKKNLNKKNSVAENTHPHIS